MDQKPYREGDEDNKENPKEDSPSEQATPGGQPKIATAFLVLVYDDGVVEGASNVPGVPMEREAGLQEMRNACSALRDDLQLLLTAKAAGAEVTTGFQKAAHDLQVRQLQREMGSGG